MKYALVFVVAMLGTAQADDGYAVSTTFGPATYLGGLRAYGTTGFRGEARFDVRRDDRTLSFVAGAVSPETGCSPRFDTTCSDAASRLGSWFFVGTNVTRRVPLLVARWSSRLNLSLAGHVGARYMVGDDALTGYHGLGVTAGASLEGNLGVIGYYVQAGVDAMYMAMPVDSVSGVAPYIAWGGKLGWL